MDNNFSSEIEALKAQNPLPLFKMLAQTMPQYMEQQVKGQAKSGASFFISFIERVPLPEVEEFLNLCERLGYSLAQNNPLNKKMPDYLKLYDLYVADEVLALITQRVGKEYILALQEQDLNPIKMAYKKRKYKTIEVLSEYGVDYECLKDPCSGISSYLDGDNKLFTLYWDTLNKRANNSHMNDEEFTHFMKIFTSKATHLTTTNAGALDDIKILYSSKKDFFNINQQKALLVKSLECENVRLFKFIANSMGHKSTSAEIKEMIWPHLGHVKHQEIIYSMLSNDNYIRKIDPQSGESFIGALSDFLKNNGYYLSMHVNSYNRTQCLVQRSLFEKLSKIIPENFWQSHANEETTWFDIVAQKDFFKWENFVNPTLKWTPYDSVELKKEKFQQLLTKTWFKINSTGETNLETIIRQNRNSFDKWWVFSNNNIEFFTTEQKTLIFKCLMHALYASDIQRIDVMSPAKSTTIIDVYHFLKTIYHSMKDDENTRWDEIEINPSREEELKASPMMKDFKAQQLHYIMKNNVPLQGPARRAKL